MRPPRVLDIEAVGEPFSGRLLCVGYDDAVYPPEALAEAWAPGGKYHPLRDLGDPEVPKIVATKYDHRWLTLYGFQVDGPIYDVQVMAWLLDEAQDLSVEALTRRYCGIEMDKRIYQVGGRVMFRTDEGPGVPLAEAPGDQLLAYNLRDLDAEFELFQELWARLESEGMLDYFLDEMVPFTRVLADMEARGVPVDLSAAEALAAELAAEVKALEDELHVDGNLPEDFNLHSSDQLGAYLYSKDFELTGRIAKDGPAPAAFVPGRTGRVYTHGVYKLRGRGLPVHARTGSGKPSTAAPKLRRYFGHDPWVAKLLELKRRQTVLTFLSAFDRLAYKGRLYGRFNQTGTVTGRLSSSTPNLQNIPAKGDLGRRVRELFRSDGSSVFVHGDYSQLEPRLMAHWSQDPVLLEVFHTEKDLYRRTAASIFGTTYDAVTDEERGITKVLVLAMGYGAGAGKVADILSEADYPTDELTASGYLRELRQVYRVFFDWRESVIERAGLEGFVRTLGGRRRRLVDRPGAGDHWKTTTLTPQQAVNAVIQGSAADVVQRVMVASAKTYPEYRLLAQVHDELLWETDEAPGPWKLAQLQQLAERSSFDLTVPLVFEPKVVETWAEGKA